MSERPKTIKDAAKQMRQSVVEEAIKRLLTAAAETEAAIAYIFAINGDPECNADPDSIEGMTGVTENLYSLLSEIREKLKSPTGVLYTELEKIINTEIAQKILDHRSRISTIKELYNMLKKRGLNTDYMLVDMAASGIADKLYREAMEKI